MVALYTCMIMIGRSSQLAAKKLMNDNDTNEAVDASQLIHAN